MSKEIWLGPVLGNNRERLLARCSELISTGHSDRLLYLAASHPLLDLVTAKLLDGSRTRGVWGEFPVYLSRGFVRRVLSTAIDVETRGVLDPRVAIDREELPLRRSLISQIIKQLAAAGKLNAIKPLANRDGCVNTIASLLGEIQRAGKTPAEFAAVIESRAEPAEPNSKFQIPDSRFEPAESTVQIPNSRFESAESTVQIPNSRFESAESKAEGPKSKGEQSPRSQLDFDREVALIYSTYNQALDSAGLSDQDSDQLRALQILRGEVDGRKVSLPWLDRAELLVLDGFFDFTPVQGEMLRLLIPAFPEVIVNLNYDPRNPEIFQPFQSTIDQLRSIDSFEEKIETEVTVVSDSLAPLRERLFNSADLPVAEPADTKAADTSAAIALFDCGDRETEIRSIAKEIKQLILQESFKLEEIALVVRERAAYAETISRVCADEGIPCNLERRVEAKEVPALRAGAKLFQLLRGPTREHVSNPKAGDLAHLVKTDYFSAAPEDLKTLEKTFDEKYAGLLTGERVEPSTIRAALKIGKWSPDILENVIAYVGSELRVKAWIDRAHRLINVLPSPEAARSFIAGSEKSEGDDAAANVEQEPPAEETSPKEIRKRPSPVHPAAIAWATLVMEHLRQLTGNTPEDGRPEELRKALVTLLDRLQFPRQVSQTAAGNHAADMPQVTLDVRGLDCLRRALAATVRAFNQAASVVASASPSESAKPPKVTSTLAAFIDEVERSLNSQVLTMAAGSQDGLRVLEATDVRGLRFRVIFIAGMIEGGFPLRTSRDWLYPHEERERLKKYGVVLEDISTDTLLKEEHYFYQSACRATDRLYLTRPLTLNDGNETVASYYLEELNRAIAPALIETRQIRSDVDTHDLRQASSATELTVGLVRQQERLRHRAQRANLLPPTEVAQLTSRAHASGHLTDSVLRRVAIELQRTGERFGQFDGQITDPDLLAMIERHFGSKHVYSASGLSAFGNCPFRFFAARVLKLEPRNEAALDLQAIDAGKLLHDILRRFFEGYRNQCLPDLNRDELLRQLHISADEVFKKHEDMVPPLNQRIWQIDCEIRKLLLTQFLLYELKLQEKTGKHGMRPAYFELAFGTTSGATDPASAKDFLRLTRPHREAIDVALLQGRIDRVDVSKDDRMAIAYDYKLSKGAPLDDIRAGRDVQIAIYLTALDELIFKDLELAGGGYYILKSGGSRRNQGLYRNVRSDYTDIGQAVRANCDEADWHAIRGQVKQRVWQFIDGMRSGSFLVNPSLGKKTCKFCDYSAVCRFDAYRISRKQS